MPSHLSANWDNIVLGLVPVGLTGHADWNREKYNKITVFEKQKRERIVQHHFSLNFMTGSSLSNHIIHLSPYQQKDQPEVPFKGCNDFFFTRCDFQKGNYFKELHKDSIYFQREGVKLFAEWVIFIKLKPPFKHIRSSPRIGIFLSFPFLLKRMHFPVSRYDEIPPFSEGHGREKERGNKICLN